MARPGRTKTEAPKYLDLWSLPALSTAEQIGQACQVSGRTVHYWSKGPNPVIPIAFQAGKVVRFNPRDVARALGLTPPETSEPTPPAMRESNNLH
jgi:hypothetical protein